MTGITTIPWEKLKFLDEVHFIHEDNRRRKVFGEVGEPAIALSYVSIKETYTMTLLTSLSDANCPVICDIRMESNTGKDFANFVYYLVRNQHLSQGDYLILDNANVHFSSNTIDELEVQIIVCIDCRNF